MTASASPPLPTSLAELERRHQRFARTVALCLCSLPLLFSAQLLLLWLANPIYADMFADFGAQLPAPTQWLIDYRYGLGLVGVFVPIVSVIAALQADPAKSVLLSTALGLLSFLIAQAASLAMFLPIFQLGAVTEGL
ncbi:hypothetical protein [Actomonas aquatica]|uniref:Uncharacterized protein n=1 Tax=Actomonas aquatica TaxID=2866162 RepID=A0ABZ1C594_9BACT|nr:hypothetical protein [Opitutus sp. WL0086]WRQ86691.1 hypothetical protein K1X11_017905 [Opitutus sp. WL0086]